MSGSGFEKLKVLIVEDNASMRTLLRALLNSAGIREIAEAANGQSGLTALREHGSNLVLCDLAMAPIDGIEFTRHVRNDKDSLDPFVPIIMISGHSEKYRVEAARDAGVTEFLAKPVTAQSLFARMAEILERPRSFVRCDSYFGPDRRRHQLENYAGPFRRKYDLQKTKVE